jgi:predicted DNA-binding transcriptional regulator YafY
VEHWVLGWGAGAEVIAPPELRQKIQATAHTLAEIYLKR